MSSPHAKLFAVIGAGPAGSVAAVRLAQLGHAVTLFEKAAFPRDKVCGECLSATGIGVLRRLNLAERMFAEVRPRQLRRASAVAADGSTTTVDLPAEMWGVTRREMDAWLANEAARAGASVLLETSASVRRGTGFQPVVCSTTRSTRAENPCHEERAFDAVILADGSGKPLDRIEPTGDFGIKAHFRDVNAPRDTIELVAITSGYAGLAPVNDGLWNAAWSVRASALKQHAGDIDRLFRAEIERSPVLRQRFSTATRAGDWLACPLPRYAVRRNWPSGVIPIGNAAAALEPVGGEGMGLAMRSAELAVDAIDAAARERRAVDIVRLRRAFDRLWRTRRAASRGGAIALSHPYLGPLTVGIANRAPALARAGLAMVGK